jgi:hypothetical protein
MSARETILFKKLYFILSIQNDFISLRKKIQRKNLN